jgi:peptide chain release factor 2
LPCSGGRFDLDKAKATLADLNQKAEDPNLWNDQQAAQQLLKERNRLDAQIHTFEGLERELKDNIELIEMGEAEGDASITEEAEAAIAALAHRAKAMEIECLFSGEADANDCFFEVHSGAGGTESQDWAQMLLRMYLRWAERHEFSTEIISELPGEEAGIKSVTVRVSGHNAYGWLKTECGVHRLVRISPFDSSARRHTSFASLWVYPVINDDFDILIE